MLGYLYITEGMPVRYFEGGIKADTYKVNMGYYFHSEGHVCPKADAFRMTVRDINAQPGQSDITIEVSRPYTETRTFRAGEDIVFPNPCTGALEKIGRVRAIHAHVELALNIKILKQVIYKPLWFKGPTAVIEVYHSWLTAYYGPVGYER